MTTNGPGAGEGAPRCFRFGGVVVDEAAHTLSRDGVLQQVEPKAFAVLLALLDRAGQLVAKDELLDTVWGHRHVTPGVLTRAIAQLRHALDDDTHHPRYIQTQHAVGYRFVGELLPGPDADTTPEPAIPRVGEGPSQQAGVAVPAESQSLPDGVVERRREPRHVHAWSTRSWAIAALLAAGISGLAIWGQRNAGPRPTASSIAVLPFANLSADRDDDYFAEGLAVEMHDALAGVDGLKVAAQMSPAAAAALEADVKALGQRLGVATVLDASVRREGQRVRINARLSDTATGYTLWSRSYDRELSDVFATQSEIANEVVGSLLGSIQGQREEMEKRLTPTRSTVAFDAYLRGLQQLRSSVVGDDVDSAIGFFSDALAADAGFARAQAGICRAEIRSFENARDADAYARALAACDRAAAMDPDLGEVDLALGDLYRVRGESAKAIEKYTRVLEDPALAADASIGIAKTHGANGRHELALRYLERALASRPADGDTYREIGNEQHVGGDLDGAIAAYRRATELQPGEVKAWSGLGGMYLLAGRKDEAGAAFQRALEIAPSYGTLSNLGTIQYEAGRYGEAERLYRQAAELKPQDYRVWGNLGDALLAQAGGMDAARPMYRRAVDLVQPYVSIKSDDAQALASSAWYQANLGEADAARELIARADALGTERGEVALWAAQALARLGEAEQARVRVEQARREGIDGARIDASPVLKGLAAPSTEQRRQ